MSVKPMLYPGALIRGRAWLRLGTEAARYHRRRSAG